MKYFHLLMVVGLLFAPHCQADSALGVPDPLDIEYPEGDPPSEQEIELGKMLFFDERLSLNQNQSCATCHNPDLGFSDGQAKSLGTMGAKVGRNTPHIYNLAWSSIFFWDGRAASLEEQALGPIEAEGEMNMPLEKLAERLDAVPQYRRMFKEVYGADSAEKEYIARAIASFERSIVSDNSPFDQYMRGDTNAMSPAAVRGMELFQGKANCIACHSGPNFTDDSFHNLGVMSEDTGRGKLIPGEIMQGAFKTPGLRNVVLTAPYMHDGSIGTLEDVVRFYNRGGDKSTPNSLVKQLHLTDAEIMDLVAFMGALTDPVRIVRPQLPPSENEMADDAPAEEEKVAVSSDPKLIATRNHD